MCKPVIMPLAALCWIIVVAATLAPSQFLGQVAEKRHSELKVDELRMSIKTEPKHWTYVENGGLGERLNLRILVSTSDWNWKLTSIDGLGFDAKPSLIQIRARRDNGPEFSVKPSDFVFVGSKGDKSGTEWTYSATILLANLVSDRSKPPGEVAIRVLFAEDIVALITQAEQPASLISNQLSIKLRPRSFAESKFTRRLHLLSPNLTTKEVERILGSPLSVQAVHPELKKQQPEYSTQWEYRNPDLKGHERLSKDKDMVRLFFGTDGKLIGYAELLYGC